MENHVECNVQNVKKKKKKENSVDDGDTSFFLKSKNMRFVSNEDRLLLSLMKL